MNLAALTPWPLIGLALHVAGAIVAATAKTAGAFPIPVEQPAAQSPEPGQLYAALDLGTNSCRMLIAQPRGGQFHVVDSFSKAVQLGHGLEASGRLSRASMALRL